MGIESLGARYSYSEGKTPQTLRVQMLGPQHRSSPNVDIAIIHCLCSDPFCTQNAAMCAKQDINSTYLSGGTAIEEVTVKLVSGTVNLLYPNSFCGPLLVPVYSSLKMAYSPSLLQ